MRDLFRNLGNRGIRAQSLRQALPPEAEVQKPPRVALEVQHAHLEAPDRASSAAPASVLSLKTSTVVPARFWRPAKNLALKLCQFVGLPLTPLHCSDRLPLSDQLRAPDGRS